MHRHIAALDGQLYGGGVLVVTAACGNELQIDGADLHPAGVVGLNPVGYLQQLADRSVGVGERAVFPEFHRACLVSAAVMCGTWITGRTTGPRRRDRKEPSTLPGTGCRYASIKPPTCHLASLRTSIC